MGYVIVGGVCLIIGGCFGLLVTALCNADKENDCPDFIEYRVWPGYPPGAANDINAMKEIRGMIGKATTPPVERRD